MYSTDTATVGITAGNIQGNLDLYGMSHTTVSGGAIASNVYARTQTDLTITGGSISGELRAEDFAVVEISGGNYGDRILALEESSITIIGSAFNFPSAGALLHTSVLLNRICLIGHCQKRSLFFLSSSA